MASRLRKKRARRIGKRPLFGSRKASRNVWFDVEGVCELADILETDVSFSAFTTAYAGAI
jgi:hypothetical protein